MLAGMPTSELDLDRLRAAYSRFLRPDRVLLTGHSHQAWPDTLREALTRYFDDSAAYVDDKWDEVIFAKQERVGARILARMGFAESDAIAFGKSTHELVYRLLSCLNLAERPRIVTTTSEFHSMHRQLARLSEAGAEVIWVDGYPRATLAERVAEELTAETRVLALSAVMFEDAYVVGGLAELCERAVSLGITTIVDDYHGFNVVPIGWGRAKDQLFVTAGGYKYAGMGEGICWLRVPPGCALRPVDTGWFAAFGGLADQRSTEVSYGPGGARFAGSTYDPSCFYRAEAALDHWDTFGLDVPSLRAISLRQTRHILDRVGARAEVAGPMNDAERGGFVTLRVTDAGAVVQRLRRRGVFVDARGASLRLGPSPYLTIDELDRGVHAVLEELG